MEGAPWTLRSAAIHNACHAFYLELVGGTISVPEKLSDAIESTFIYEADEVSLREGGRAA